MSDIDFITATRGGRAIHAWYKGQRTGALYYPSTGRVEIIDGPQAGKSFLAPSPAGEALTGSASSGWNFWTVSDTGQPLQSIRPRPEVTRRPAAMA